MNKISKQLKFIAKQYNKIYTAGLFSDLWNKITGKNGDENLQQTSENLQQIEDNEKQQIKNTIQQVQQQTTSKLTTMKENGQIGDKQYKQFIQYVKDRIPDLNAELFEKAEENIDSVETYINQIKNSKDFENWEAKKEILIDATKDAQFRCKTIEEVMLEKFKNAIKFKDMLQIKNIKLDALKLKHNDLLLKLADLFKKFLIQLNILYNNYRIGSAKDFLYLINNTSISDIEKNHFSLYLNQLLQIRREEESMEQTIRGYSTTDEEWLYKHMKERGLSIYGEEYINKCKKDFQNFKDFLEESKKITIDYTSQIVPDTPSIDALISNLKSKLEELQKQQENLIENQSIVDTLSDNLIQQLK